MEEIGKLIHELFDDLKKENAELKEALLRSDAKNRKMEKITDIIAPLATKSYAGQWYMDSLWGKKFEELADLLGIELKEEEEENDTV